MKNIMIKNSIALLFIMLLSLSCNKSSSDIIKKEKEPVKTIVIGDNDTDDNSNVNNDDDSKTPSNDIKINFGEDEDYRISQIGSKNTFLPKITPSSTEYTYSWKVNGLEVSTEMEYSLTPTELGMMTTTLEVTLGDNKSVANAYVFVPKPKIGGKYKIVGYQPYYTDFDENQLSKVTDICYAFLLPKSGGNLDYSKVESGDFKTKFDNLITKAHKDGVRVLISVGGSPDPNHPFSNTILNKEYRDKMAQSLIDFVKRHNIDGIDVDYEEWAWGADNSLDDRRTDALLELYKTLKAGLGNRLLTIAAAQKTNYKEEMIQYLDFIYPMLYDQTGTWAESPYGQHSPYSQFTQDTDYWVNTLNAPTEKIIPGVPFYGHEFKDTDGGLAVASRGYEDILKDFPEAYNKDNEGLIFYNGIPTLEKKVDYAKEHNFGGIMIWELSQDIAPTKEHSLLNTIYKRLN